MQVLRCSVQNYAWGKLGKASKVAQFGVPSDKVEQKLPYAELWMGTHHKAPSYLAGSETTLREHLGADLPYLFKVLSINKCLSIQAHPDLQLARRLHKDRPKVYKDPNHKPEMAVALTRFEAMCGFRPLEEIRSFVSEVPELAAVLGSQACQDFTQALGKTGGQVEALRALFTVLMKADPDVVKQQLGKLIPRLTKQLSSKSSSGERKSQSSKGQSTLQEAMDPDELIVRLHGQHGADVGCFAVYFLNCFACPPGAAIFLPANEPHAYVSGDIVESMACSDNVVRAGCTPKLRDVDTLCNMLTYRARLPEVLTGSPYDQDQHKSTTVYAPPIDEFRVHRTEVLPGASVNVPAVPGTSIVLAVAGSGRLSLSEGKAVQVSQGMVIAVPDHAVTRVSVDKRAGGPLVLYQCFAPKEGGKQSRL